MNHPSEANAFPTLLTISEVARILDVGVQRVYQLAREKVIPVVHVGPRQIRVNPQALEAWIKQGGMAR